MLIDRDVTVSLPLASTGTRHKCDAHTYMWAFIHICKINLLKEEEKRGKGKRGERKGREGKKR